MKYCIFSAPSKDVNRFFQLNDDGSITDIVGKGHDNERFWIERNEEFIILSKNKEITGQLKYKSTDDHFVYYEGVNSKGLNLLVKITNKRNDLIRNKTKYLHSDDIKKGIMKVGDHTYGAIKLVDKNYGKVIVGDYCSIAAGVTVVVGNHRTDMVSTYPFKYLSNFFVDIDLSSEDHVSKGPVIIGNDVWIGRNSIIMSGVEIGDGAVIASHSVVTKDVEPYSMVGGNPARHLKYRISDEVKRKKMLEIAWWHWDEKSVIDNLEYINSPDIDGFIKKFNKIGIL